MVVVLKNDKILEEKIVSLIEETASKGDAILTLLVDEKIYDTVNLTVRSMNMGSVKYGQETLFVTKLGVKLEVKKVDKYK